VFALAFVTVGVKRIDSQANGSRVAFRLLIFPGSVAFWRCCFADGLRERMNLGREESAPMIQPSARPIAAFF